MSGEAGFVVDDALYSIFVGSGVSVSIAVTADRPNAVAEHFAAEEKGMRGRFERAARDVKALLESMRDDGVPLVPRAGAAVHATLERTGRDMARFRLEIGASRPLSEGERDAVVRGVELLLWPPLPAVRKVHHLSCATLCMLGGTLVNEHKKLVCHCLLLETEQGLVLVDTGLGVDCIEKAPLHTSGTFQRVYRPVKDVGQCAVRQIARLGFNVDDVRHIVLTHLDFDHAGGLPDFPKATVHLLADELAAANARATYFERMRYSPSLWAHDVKWARHETKGERWYGFPCVRDLPGLPPEILLVPLAGHTRGHSGVAVDVGGRWILHCGDAYFHKDEMDADDPWCSPMLAVHQRVIAADDKLRRANQKRLRELARGVGEGISVFCAHDPDDLARLRGE